MEAELLGYNQRAISPPTLGSTKVTLPQDQCRR